MFSVFQSTTCFPVCISLCTWMLIYIKHRCHINEKQLRMLSLTLYATDCHRMPDKFEKLSKLKMQSSNYPTILNNFLSRQEKLCNDTVDDIELWTATMIVGEIKSPKIKADEPCLSSTVKHPRWKIYTWNIHAKELWARTEEARLTVLFETVFILPGQVLCPWK